MDFKVLAAIGLLFIALAAWLAISIVTSVGRYARRFVEGSEDKRRGFEVKVVDGQQAGESHDAGASENAPATKAVQADPHRDEDG